MNLEGKVINFLGDSITEGHGTSDLDKVFHQIIKQKHNLKFAYNNGIGGTRIARKTVPSEKPRHDLTFEIRAEIMDRSADAVVVFGGTNDYGHGDAHFGDIDSEDIYTFCGGMNSLITKLKNDFPDADIIFMTPIHRLNETIPDTPDGKILADYAEMIKTICAKRDIKVIDLFGINPLDPADETLVPDGLHPNDEGHAVLASVVAEELLKL